MKRFWLTGFGLLMSWTMIGGSSDCLGQSTTTPPQEPAPTTTRQDYVSEASFIVGTYSPARQEQSPLTKANAANAFLDSLSTPLRERAGHALQSDERRQWTNLPASPNAGGVRMGDLNGDQVKLACDLLAQLLSKQGYDKVRDIMLADDQLLRGGRARQGFGTENFSIVIFGKPSATEPWGYQIDGHHAGVNLAMQGEAVSMSPSFIGMQPQSFQIANTKFSPFANETGQAYQLVESLTDEQVKMAVLGPQRAQIVTGPGRDNQVPNAKGIPCQNLDEAQQKILLSLIRQWVGDLPQELAEKRMKQIESELKQMHFAWNGGKAVNNDMSYSIQSPTLIIEFACQGSRNDPLSHMHSIYRDPTNEYGKQLSD